MELKTITKVVSREVSDIYTLKVGGEDVIVTAEHPFYVIYKGWVKVKDLRVADNLKTADGKVKAISAITKKSKNIKVYNIEVDGNHNYFVSPIKVLVHKKNIGNVSDDKTFNHVK